MAPLSQQRFTNIIVGGGTTGCLLANRLASDPTRRVVLIEAGGHDTYYPWFHIPIGYLFCIGNPRADWLYRTQPCEGINNRSLKYPRGRVLGGCSAINGMIYMRGQSRDYDLWANLTGDRTWSWERVLPLFKRHEHHHGGDSEFHGGGGELYVSKQRLRWDLLDAFQDGAVSAGIPATSDFNRGNNEGVGYFEVNQKNGWRWSSRAAFLSNAFQRQHRDNLWIATHRLAQQLLFGDAPSSSLSSKSPRRVRGVRIVSASSTPTASESKTFEDVLLDETDHRSEVILTAGAIGSPSLLMRSGIGAEADVKALGEPQLVNRLDGVGRNLQDHLQVRTVFEVQGIPSLNTMSRNPIEALKMGVQYAAGQRGPLSMAPSQLGIFTHCTSYLHNQGGGGGAHSPQEKQALLPNVEFHVQPLSLDAFGEPLHPFDAITVSICNLNPTSRGQVRVVSMDPHAHPLLDLNYLGTPEDRHVAGHCIKLARHLARESSFAKYVKREVFPGDVDDSGRGEGINEDLATAAGRIATTIFHPVGTCKMGPSSDPMSVVDSTLRVHGIDNLRIADASVMPTITSGNTNAPCLMIAEKLAHLMLSQQQ